MTVLQRLARVVNTVVQPIAASGRVGSITVIGYTGRRSGAEFRLPVGFSRSGDAVTIRVEAPGQKTWWRNFTGEGAQLWIRLDGVDRPGHAVAVQDGRRVRVDVVLQ